MRNKTKEMPQEWKIVRLEDIASVERGKFSIRPRNNPEYYGGKIPFLQTGDVTSSNGYVTKYNQTLNNKGLKVSRFFPSGTILITIAANIGDIAKVCFDFACTDSLVAIQAKNDISKTWLKYFLETKKSYFESRATQNAQANINLQTIRPTPILLPPLPEQKAIADLLMVWDEAIERSEKLIKAKEKRFKWLLKKLISGELEGKEQEEKNSKNSSEWEKVKLGEVLTESRIIDYENDSKKRLSVRLHLKGVEIRAYRGTESENATAYFMRKTGQLIYGKQNIFKGAIGIVPKKLDGFSSTQDLPAFDISKKVAKKWLFFYFTLPNFYKKLETLSSGSGSKRLHPKELYKLEISLPPLSQQIKIAETLTDAQDEIDILKNIVKKYKEQKKGLMQKLLTGIWRVKLNEKN